MKGDLKLNNYPHFPTAFPNFSAQDGVRQFNTLPFSEGEHGYPTASPYGSSGYPSDDFGSYPFLECNRDILQLRHIALLEFLPKASEVIRTPEASMDIRQPRHLVLMDILPMILEALHSRAEASK